MQLNSKSYIACPITSNGQLSYTFRNKLFAFILSLTYFAKFCIGPYVDRKNSNNIFWAFL